MITSALLRSWPDRAFESLYRKHVKDVYSYCAALLDRQADAEDATQTTFLNAYRALERGERPRDPRKWLRAVALNVCREHYRRAGRRPDEVSLQEDPGDLVIEPSVPEIGDVMRGLSCLPFNQRAALVMREFEGRSLAEIARSLDVSASAVEALLFRARRALREQLEDQLTCGQAELAISRQLDGALPRSERGPLRAHLRQCHECAALARRVRAQRSAIRSLALLPLPAALKWSRFAGGGAAPASAAAAPAVVTKLAAVVLAGTAIGVGYTTLSKTLAHPASAHGSSVLVARSGTRASGTASSAGSRTTPNARGRAARGSAAPSSHGRSTARHSAGAARTSAATRSRGSSHGHSSSTHSGSAHSHASPTGVAHRAPNTPASHGNQKPFKGTGHAYGRSAPKKTHPTALALHPSHPVASAPGQLSSTSNKGHTSKLSGGS